MLINLDVGLDHWFHAYPMMLLMYYLLLNLNALDFFPFCQMLIIMDLLEFGLMGSHMDVGISGCCYEFLL